MKKLVVLTGAGMSQESGIRTFRDSVDGLWEEYDIKQIASIDGWNKNPEIMLKFYNERRKQLYDIKPNSGHIGLAKLEKDFDVTIVTQNVDDLHERAGSTNIIHVHGELLKSRSSIDPNLIYDCNDDIKIGDLCSKGSQIRPHVVWFGEAIPYLNNASNAVADADILVIIGTSFDVSTASYLIQFAKRKIPIFYIDPDPAPIARKVYILKEKAVKGIDLLIDELKSLK